jgi:hypothetical protein
MAKFTFRRDVSYSEYFEVEAESPEAAREILETADDISQYEAWVTDNLYEALELDEEGEG